MVEGVGVVVEGVEVVVEGVEGVVEVVEVVGVGLGWKEKVAVRALAMALESGFCRLRFPSMVCGVEWSGVGWGPWSGGGGGSE